MFFVKYVFYFTREVDNSYISYLKKTHLNILYRLYMTSLVTPKVQTTVVSFEQVKKEQLKKWHC